MDAAIKQNICIPLKLTDVNSNMANEYYKQSPLKGSTIMFTSYYLSHKLIRFKLERKCFRLYISVQDFIRGILSAGLAMDR